MQFNYPKILPSFTFALTAKPDDDFPDLPDYYRKTRKEEYGPTCRIVQERPVDLMKTIDHRFRDSTDYEYDFIPPSPFVNNDEDARSSTVFEHTPQRHMSFSSTEKTKPSQSRAARRPLATFWHSMKSTARRLHCAKRANLNFD